MKVYIGNYATNHIRSGLFDAYMNKKYGIVKWPENYTKLETLIEKFDDAVQSVYDKTINKLIKNRNRKIKVRIDPYDTWNMDNTLAHIILPMLRQLKETKHGSPMVDDEDVPEHLRSTSAPPKENEWDSDENFFKRWDWVLDEMIHAFETILDDSWDIQFHTGTYDIDWETGVKGPNHTHLYDKDAYKKAWDRRQNGMRLFGKYYNNLWD
jgi:hypothetical protein